MASVKKFPGSSVWYACYKLPTGQFGPSGRPHFKRVQRSTGLCDKERALQLAISYERVAMEVAHKRSMETAARRLLLELQVIGGFAMAEMEQTESFLNRWLEGKRKHVANKTWLNFSGIIGDFLEWLGPRKKNPLVEVTPRVVADFRDAEVARGKQGTTINKALSVLGQAFEEAVTQMALERNPARGLRIKRADDKAQERKAFTFEQFKSLVQATAPGEKSKRGNEVHPDWQTFILTTGYTGGRQQEVAKLLWANVDFSQHVIGLLRSKNGDTHFMPMHPALEKHLLKKLASETKEATREKYVMPHMATLKEREISKIFRETVLPRVGISQPYVPRTEGKGVGRKLAEYSVHSLRHSLSTWLKQAGVEELMRMRLVGHEDHAVNRNYTHTGLAEAAAEIAKVPDCVD